MVVTLCYEYTDFESTYLRSTYNRVSYNRVELLWIFILGMVAVAAVFTKV